MMLSHSSQQEGRVTTNLKFRLSSWLTVLKSLSASASKGTVTATDSNGEVRQSDMAPGDVVPGVVQESARPRPAGPDSRQGNRFPRAMYFCFATS